MWGIFLNKLWNIFGAIVVMAIILAAVVGVMYLMTLGGPVVIFIFAFLFVIATCFVDAHRKRREKEERLAHNMHMSLNFIKSRHMDLLWELNESGYSERAKSLIDAIKTEIQKYEDRYGTDTYIQNAKTEFNNTLEQYIK